MSRKKVGLALGGGAARGLGHVGVIGALEQAGVPIDCIAGTSVGSVVGSAYAAGIRGERLVEMALHVRWQRLARFAWSRFGLFSFAPLENYVAAMVHDCRIEDLPLPFACVATDILTGEPVVLREGRVASAVRASCSVPGIVTPLELGGRLLTDGGMSNNLPVSVARSLGADVIIGVCLMAPVGRRPRHLVDVILAAGESLIANAGDPRASADVSITLATPGLRSLVRLSNARQALALGRSKAEEALPAIQGLLDQG